MRAASALYLHCDGLQEAELQHGACRDSDLSATLFDAVARACNNLVRTRPEEYRFPIDLEFLQHHLQKSRVVGAASPAHTRDTTHYTMTRLRHSDIRQAQWFGEAHGETVTIAVSAR